MARLLSAIKSGRVRAIGVTTSKRNPQLPEVPTIAESGVPGYEVIIWYALYVPSGTPKPAIARLNAETAKALNSAELKERLTLQGLDVAASMPEELTSFTQSETVKWVKVVKAASVQLE